MQVQRQQRGSSVVTAGLARQGHQGEERILSGSDKIILDAGQNSAHGIVPVLPLNDLMRQQLQHPAAQGPKAATTSGGSQ